MVVHWMAGGDRKDGSRWQAGHKTEDRALRQARVRVRWGACGEHGWQQQVVDALP
jgi:hypothetical protein